jgi:hypothetical protein
MARSFYRPSAAGVVEDYERNNRFFHAASNRHYRMLHRDGRFFQQRYQLQQDREVNLFEQEIHYVIGSGNHARSYLHLSAGGVLTQLPVTWYPQEKRWGMSPGYDRKQHYDFSRKIDYGCVFCHNATPNLTEGVDRYGRENLFPQELPSGIDCQRCHGPGSQHVASAAGGKGLRRFGRRFQSSPAESNARWMSVNNVTGNHQRRTAAGGAGSGSRYHAFRPGEALSDYLIHFDHAAGTGRDDKFEISLPIGCGNLNAQKSGGRLTCTLCHNPHRTPRGAEVQRFHRAV